MGQKESKREQLYEKPPIDWIMKMCEVDDIVDTYKFFGTYRLMVKNIPVMVWNDKQLIKFRQYKYGYFSESYIDPIYAISLQQFEDIQSEYKELENRKRDDLKVYCSSI